MSGDEKANDSSDNHDPLTEEERLNYIKEFETLLSEVETLRARADRLVQNGLRELAGAKLPTMLTSLDAALEFLHDPDPRLRRAAIQVVSEHWKAHDRLASECEDMARDDPDSQVKESAIGALGSCYSGTRDKRIAKLLASTVINKDLAGPVRLRAYLALLRVHGPGQLEDRIIPVAQSLSEIDLAFVDRFLLP